MILQGDTYDMKVLHMTGIFSFTEWIHIFAGHVSLGRTYSIATLHGRKAEKRIWADGVHHKVEGKKKKAKNH